MCLKCIFLKVLHSYISESLSKWVEQGFQIEILAKSGAGGAFSGGAYIKKACNSNLNDFKNLKIFQNQVISA